MSTGPEVKAEFAEIRTGINEELRASEGMTKRELLEPANRYRLLLGVFLFCGQQCTGMTALAYFGPQFFKLLVGNDPSRSLLITGLFGAEKFITVGIYILFFSEMWGRKPTLWISAILMAICFIIVTVVNNTTPKPQQEVTSSGIATVAMIFLTNSIYQFSWGPLPWPYTTEVRSIPFLRHFIHEIQSNELSRFSQREFERSVPPFLFLRSGYSIFSFHWLRHTCRTPGEVIHSSSTRLWI